MPPVIHPASSPDSHARPRVLVWDCANTSSVLVAQAFRGAGWQVDRVGPEVSPARGAPAFDGDVAAEAGDEETELFLGAHPLDGLVLHGDRQVRWLLARWDRLRSALKRHLPDRDALRIALSKKESMEHAKRLGIPVLPTEEAATPREAERAAARLAPDGEAVLKADGGAAGSAVRAHLVGRTISDEDWAALTRHSPVVLVQRRIHGPRALATVAYDRGREVATVIHEKVAAFPPAFGVTAFGVTRGIEAVASQVSKLLGALSWHGLANAEFRQDLADRRWYFMEINPRAPSSLGIQAAAGVDLAALWAAISAGEHPARRASWREGVRFAWTIPALALIANDPAKVPFWGWTALASGKSDWSSLEATTAKITTLRLARWLAKNS